MRGRGHGVRAARTNELGRPTKVHPFCLQGEGGVGAGREGAGLWREAGMNKEDLVRYTYLTQGKGEGGWRGWHEQGGPTHLG